MSELKSHEHILLGAAGKPGEDNLIGLLTVGTAAPNDTEEPGERKVTLVGVPGKASGEVDIYLDRLDLTEVLKSKGPEAIALRGADVAQTEIVRILQEEFGLNVLVVDLSVQDGDFFEGSDQIQYLTMPADPESLLYRGNLNIILAPLLAGQEGVVLINTPGEDLYPVGDLTPIAIEPAAALSAAETKSDGTLLAGLGNPNGGLTSVTNGEITLSLAPRVWKSLDLPVGDDGVYDVKIAADGDWNFVFAAALGDNAPVLSLVDLYDLTMTWSLVEGEVAQSIVFTAVKGSGNQIDWVSADGKLRINDSAGTVKVTQNIQRLTHYLSNGGVEYFTPATKTTVSAAPLGEFELSITAVRKNSLADPVTVQVSALVSEIVPEPPVDEEPPADEPA